MFKFGKTLFKKVMGERQPEISITSTEEEANRWINNYTGYEIPEVGGFDLKTIEEQIELETKYEEEVAALFQRYLDGNFMVSFKEYPVGTFIRIDDQSFPMNLITSIELLKPLELPELLESVKNPTEIIPSVWVKKHEVFSDELGEFINDAYRMDLATIVVRLGGDQRLITVPVYAADSIHLNLDYAWKNGKLPLSRKRK